MATSMAPAFDKGRHAVWEPSGRASSSHETERARVGLYDSFFKIYDQIPEARNIINKRDLFSSQFGDWTFNTGSHGDRLW